jgi:oxygen-independent coproporphyrinogen-3 oxidase
LGPGIQVSQLHLGGGSPTFLSDDELVQLMAEIGKRFKLVPSAELSIEVDPRTVDAGRLARLKAMGFNRLSFGVQDFDPEVQKAVHRIQPPEQVQALVEAARALKFDSINVDLIYGLPQQTPVSFRRTIEQVCALQPDRIALYGYAHLPARFAGQHKIQEAWLPSATDKLAMLQESIAFLTAQGYQYIGMDHFALPEDELAVAQRAFQQAIRKHIGDIRDKYIVAGETRAAPR